MAWLRRHGYVDDRPLEGGASEPGAIEACAAIAMQRGMFTKLAADDEDGRAQGESPDLARARFTVEHEGFNLHLSAYDTLTGAGLDPRVAVLPSGDPRLVIATQAARDVWQHCIRHAVGHPRM